MTLERPPEEPVSQGSAPPAVPLHTETLPAHVAGLADSIAELKTAVAVILALLSRPPVHLFIDRLHTDRLAFYLGDIEIGTLSGALNVGINQMVSGGGAARRRPDRRRCAASGRLRAALAPAADGGSRMTRPQSAGPAVDLTRAGEWLVLRVSLPGLSAGDFRLSLVGSQQVYVEGTVPYRYPVPREGLALSERAFGPFSRTISLPLPVDAAGADIRFEGGVLTASLRAKLGRIPLQWAGREGSGGAGGE